MIETHETNQAATFKIVTKSVVSMCVGLSSVFRDRIR